MPSIADEYEALDTPARVRLLARKNSSRELEVLIGVNSMLPVSMRSDEYIADLRAALESKRKPKLSVVPEPA